MSKRFGIVILAAGASSRLGRPKQLLPYLGKTLVEHAARTAIASGAAEVIVVVGAESDAVREKLQGLPVRIVRNVDWAEGMGGSIRCGVAALQDGLECAVVALCDQPRITPDLLRELALRQIETGSRIVASSYDGVVGAPCAFGRELFADLMALQGDAGARDLIRNSAAPVETVAFSGGNVDVDTPDDYRQLVPEAERGEPGDAYRAPKDARGPPMAMHRGSSPA
jgi:molybdenum cofactor cytidylyltransferase